MKLFLDTNVLVAAVTHDSKRSDAAVQALNSKEGEEIGTSILNLMELRTVLAKKKHVERDRIDRIERRITARMTITFPDASDIIAADRLQSDSLLYPMDALILAAAEANDATLCSFDSELLEHGAVSPADIELAGE